MVESSVIDGHVILERAKVIASVGYATSTVVVIDDAVHADNEHDLWTMLYEGDWCAAW